MDYDKQRKEFQQLLNAKIEVLKKLPPAKMKKMKDAAVKDLNEMKAKKEKFDKVINLLKEKMQDVWVPAPLFIEQEKEIKTEKMNKDIPECVVRIIFGKTTYVKDKSLYLIVTHEGKHETKFEQKNQVIGNKQLIGNMIKENSKYFTEIKLLFKYGKKNYF